MKIRTYTLARLAAGLLVAAFALACSAILDTDELGNETPDARVAVEDGAGFEDGFTSDADMEPQFDMGVCVPDKTCTIGGGLLGRCNFGKTKCLEGGSGICEADFEQTSETCDGVTNYTDQDCDGKKDNEDNGAHSSCGSGKYCAQVGDTNKAECASGCWKDSHCTGKTDSCVEHVCKCGTSAPCTGSDTCQEGQCVGQPPPDAGVDESVPDPDLAAPDPDLAAPEPDLAAPEPDLAAPEPDLAAPEPDLAAPDQGTSDLAAADQTS